MDVALMEKLEAIEKEQGEQRKLVELAIELMCPKCGPAAIVRMHPELGPATMRPALPVENVTVASPPNGHVHD